VRREPRPQHFRLPARAKEVGLRHHDGEVQSGDPRNLRLGPKNADQGLAKPGGENVVFGDAGWQIDGNQRHRD